MFYIMSHLSKLFFCRYYESFRIKKLELFFCLSGKVYLRLQKKVKVRT